LEVGNHKRRTLNTRLSSGTSAGTFACPRGLTEIAQAKQVRKTNQTIILYPIKKRVGKSIFTFRTQNLVNFFFEGFRSTPKSREFLFRGVQVSSFFGCPICGSIPGSVNFLRSPFNRSDFTKKFWKSEKNEKYNFCGFQNFEKFELTIFSIRTIRIIRKKSLIRIIRIFGQRINKIFVTVAKPIIIIIVCTYRLLRLTKTSLTLINRVLLL